MDGLRIDLMDVNKFIKLNHLENSVITDVQYITNGHPTPGGLLSYEIFGSSVDDRKERMGIIDLHAKYMTPLAAKKLPAYDRKLNAILTSTTRYKLVDGELIEDDISGRTGPSFLYEIWGKYKPKEKKSITTKEIEKFFSMPRELLFIEYLPVIPAFFRDVNSQSGGKMSLADINSIYSRIITLAENLNKFTDSFGLIRPQSEARLQSSLVDVYDQLVIKKVKGSPSKFGMLRRYWQSKSITYTARMVITAPILTRDTVEDTQVKFGYATVPMSYVCSTFFPFVIHELKNFLDSEFIRGGKYPCYNSKTKKIEYVDIEESYDENDITNMITKFLNSPSTRFDLLPIPGKYGPNHDQTMYMTIVGRKMKDATSISRPATITDILYMVACEVAKDKHYYITRYPLDSYQGQVPMRIQVSSTVRTMPVQIGETTYQFYPIIEGDPSNSFIETLGFSNTYLEGFNGDLTVSKVMVPALATVYKQVCERLTSGVYKYVC